MHFNIAIFQPLLLSFINSAKEILNGKDIYKNLFFLLLGLCLIAGLFLLSKFITIKILSIDIIGEIVAKRVLSMLLMTIFFMVFFSALITSLTSFYLAEDLQTILSLPVGFESIFYSRFLKSLLNSSWVPLCFTLPVLYGFASAFQSNIEMYLLIILLLVSFFIIPVALATIFITIIVRLFPATRIREVLIIGGIIGFSLLYVWFRLYEPERFLNPEGLSTMIEFVVKFDIPSSILLPSTWTVEIIFQRLKNLQGSSSLIVALISTSIAITTFASLFVNGIYIEAFSKSMEGRKNRFQNNIIGNTLDVLPTRTLSGTIMKKDLLEFIRQPSQWSQTILIVALLIVYIYNFKYFKNIELTGLISQWGLYFLNMGLCGLVVASLSVRFVYPAISLERGSFYLYRVAPIEMKHLITAKFIIYSAPITLISVIITVVSNVILRSDPSYFIISVVMSSVIGIVVSGLGISIGAIYPNFAVEDPASIPASHGGVIYMIASISSVIILILLTVWPTSLLRFPKYAIALGYKTYLIIGIHIILIAGILIFSTYFMLKYATKRISRYE